MCGPHQASTFIETDQTGKKSNEHSGRYKRATLAPEREDGMRGFGTARVSGRRRSGSRVKTVKTEGWGGRLGPPSVHTRHQQQCVSPNCNGAQACA